MKKGSLKEGTASAVNATAVTGVANATRAIPNSMTNAEVNAGLQEVVSNGLKPVKIGSTEVASPAKLRKGAADERDTVKEIPASGGSAGRVSNIGQTATVTPKRIA